LLLLQRSFQPQVSQTPLADAFVQPQRLRLRVSRLRLDVVVPSQLLLADGCALPLQLQLIASPLLLSAIALVQPLQFFQIPVCLLLLTGGCARPQLQLLVVRLLLNVPALFRLQSYQLLPAVECVQPLLRPRASLFLLSAIALVLTLQFFQIQVCLLLLAGGCARPLLQLLVVQLQLSGTTRLRLRSCQILISRNIVSVAQQPQPVLVLLQQQSPATVSRTPVVRTTSARTPKSSEVAPFLRPLPPFGRLQPTCIVLVHKRGVHFQFFPVQLSSARVDDAAFK